MAIYLARKTIQSLKPYLSARKIGGVGTIWLNANEYPTQNNDVYWASELQTAALNRYPEPQPEMLIKRYADYANVLPECVLVTRGGDEGIELVIRGFCENDEAILCCPPTYGMYKISADTFGIATKSVALTTTHCLDIPAIARALDGVKVVFVCNPNNPTGTCVTEQIIELLNITAKRAIVVIDEAYIEFCGEQTMAKYLAQFEHLVIIRTLSKAFALAGIRVGFVLANPPIIKLLQTIIAPYPIPTPSAVIANLALSAPAIHQMHANVAKLLDEKNEFVRQLKQLPQVVNVIESMTNFVLVEFEDGPVVFDALWQLGIILRNQHHLCNNCIRITIGSKSHNDCVIKALKALNKPKTFNSQIKG